MEGGDSLGPSCLLSWFASFPVEYGVPASEHTQEMLMGNKEGVPA